MAVKNDKLKKKSEAACSVYDWTIPVGVHTVVALVALLRQVFKKWTFQKESSATEYLHYQGRGFLIKPKRWCELNKWLAVSELKGMHVFPTVTENLTGEPFYVMKLDTRVEGPWCDRTWKDPPFIPRQYQGLMDRLYPYQEAILASRDEWQPRYVNILRDSTGNRGKSSISCLGELLHGGIDLPILSDHKELTQLVCNKLRDSQNRDPKLIMLDLPRAMTQDSKRLAPFMMAIEQIKKGHVADCRNHYKDWWFNSPTIWVFCNEWPPVYQLSQDRWRLWVLNDELELVRLTFSECSGCSGLEQ